MDTEARRADDKPVFNFITADMHTTPIHQEGHALKAQGTAMKTRALAQLLSLSLSLPMTQALAASELSAVSMLPVAVSVAAPVALLSAGAALTVLTVQAASGATVWVLERASDSAQASLTLSGQLAGGVSVAAGTAVLVVACSAGWVLSAAGKAIAFIPNEMGKALLYNERITR